MGRFDVAEAADVANAVIGRLGPEQSTTVAYSFLNRHPDLILASSLESVLFSGDPISPMRFGEAMYLVHRFPFRELLVRLTTSARSLYLLEGAFFSDALQYNTQAEVALQGLMAGARGLALTPSPALAAVLQALSRANRPIQHVASYAVVPTDPGDRAKLAQIVERAARETANPDFARWLARLREGTPGPQTRKSRKKANRD